MADADLASRLIDKAREILKFTTDLTMDGAYDSIEQQINDYEKMVDEREELVEEFTRLRGESPLDEQTKEALTQIFTEIAAADKRHAAVIQGVKDSMQVSMKDVRSGIRLSNAYSHVVDDDISGVFDTKQ